MTDWQRVTKRNPCPVCGKPDWCMVSADGSVVICPRTPEGAEREMPDAGYLHRLSEKRTPHHRSMPVSRQFDVDRIDWLTRNNVFQSALSRDRLERCAWSLGVSPSSLKQMRAGFCTREPALTFPMFNAAGSIVGIRLRIKRNGTKRQMSVRGGHEGIFTPRGFSASSPLLICEGPTDTAAMIDLGFDTIGRPSCRGATEIIATWLRAHWYHKVIVIADRDGPGMEGATALKNRINHLAASVRVVTPPAKDAREWKRTSVTHAEVMRYIKGAGAGDTIVSNDTAPARF